MERFDKIAKAYSENIINLIKGSSIQEAITPLCESVESRHFTKIASEHTKAALLPFASNSNNQLRGFDKFSDSIGTHPDFKKLEDGGEEYSYAVNVFVDIKGSTLLVKKMTLGQVRLFKNKVITTAIQIFQAFGGHIQRLQGDAVYAVFCWKGIKKSDSIIAALNATSFLNYVIDFSNEQFQTEFGTSLYIRTGIDFGDDNDVLWSKYGIFKCTEVTTTSLHTDLACKMQQHALDNEIIIGKNVKEFLDLPSEFYSDKDSDSFNQYDYQIFVFKWKEYLSSFSNHPNKKGLIHNHISPIVFISCEYAEGLTNQYLPYIANTKAINKNASLKFTINNFVKGKYDKIKWRVENRGEEAKNDYCLGFKMPRFDDQTFCLQTTKYTGHHYMICELFQNGRLVANEFFGIFVNDK